jgi:mannose-1-phosphate guanylyltransferase/phosphomannomutase
MPIQAAILAGGEGTRMRSLSDTPKVLLPVGGKPILAHQLAWLKRYGFARAFLCLGYRADVIEKVMGDGSEFGVHIDYRVEDSPRGTAGAVKDLGDSLEDDLLVIYGDLFVDIDCRKLLDFHASHDGVATVVVRRTDHPEDSDIVETDENGQIRAVGRLASGEVSGNLGCTAVWVIRRELLNLIPDVGLSDFARDVFPAAARAGDKMMAYETTDFVRDIGTPSRYEKFLESYRGG